MSEWVDVDEWVDVEQPRQQSTFSKYQRPVAQGIGTAAGTILGMGTAGPVGAVAGGAGGYAIGSQLADVIDEQLGERQPATFPQAASNAAGYLREGLEGEAIGLGVGAAAPLVLKGARGVYRGVKNTFSPEAELSEILQTLQRAGDAESLARAEEIKRQIPGLDYTYGMGANNRGMLSVERAAINTGEQDAAESLIQRNQDALRNKLQNEIPGDPRTFTGRLEKDVAKMDDARNSLGRNSTQQAGQDFKTVLDESQKPVKAAMEKLEREIPDYPVSLESTRKTIGEILQDKTITQNQRNAVATYGKYLSGTTSKLGESTHTAFGARRTLNDEINKAYRNDDEGTAALLLQVKKAIDSDLGKLGEKARTGQLKTYNGKVIKPDDLADELERNVIEVSRIQSDATPDVQAVVSTLKQRGIGGVDRVSGETTESYANRILQQAKRANIDIPTKSVDSKRVADLEARNKEIATILQNVEPGQDVAAAMNAYNRYAENEFFGRFDTDAIRKATRGNVLPENMTRQFTTKTGAQQLKRAIGQENATQIMAQHYGDDLSKLLTKNPDDKQLRLWLKNNSETLNELGLQREFTTRVMDQIGYNKTKKILGTDTERLFESIATKSSKEQRQSLVPIINRVKDDPAALHGLKASFRDYFEKQMLTPMAAGREGFGRIADTYEKLKPTMEVLFSPNERQAMQTIMEGVTLTQRLTTPSVLGGSQTGEIVKAAEGRILGKKQTGLVSVLFGILTGAATAAGTGNYWAGIVTGSAATSLKDWAAKQSSEKLRGLFVKAMFDPKLAQQITSTTKGGKIDDEAAKQFISLATKSAWLAAP